MTRPEARSAVEDIALAIRVIRGQRHLRSGIAAIFRVTTKRLNEQVERSTMARAT